LTGAVIVSSCTGSIRPLVLGLLAQQPRSGYDIKRYLKSMNWLIGSPSYGSLYPALRTLLQDGLVTVDIVLSKDKPARKIYQITEAGQLALREWLDRPVAPDASLKTFVKRLILASNLPRARLMADLAQRRDQVASHQALLEGIAASLGDGSDPVRRLALEYGLALAVAELAWLDGAPSRLSPERAAAEKHSRPHTERTARAR
ncbi:MAG: PadR family transcriptional regulator, partial [Anaerolineales bacterium]